ncbi:MAG: hypothetical protein KQH57_03880 [Actinomycetales bacterium]|nr:hypothetical protein [Actinomycetales bacterium]
MTLAALLALLLVVTVVVLGARLAVLISTDGLGHRPPPRSHRDWTEDVPGIPPR